MSVATILLLIIIVIMLGGFRDWGPGPFYGMGNTGALVLVVIIALLLLGHLR